MAETKEFSVLEEVEISGTVYSVGDVVNLSSEDAAPLLEASQIEEKQDEEEAE